MTQISSDLFPKLIFGIEKPARYIGGEVGLDSLMVRKTEER